MPAERTSGKSDDDGNPFTLSRFADEIDPDLEAQLDAFDDLDIAYFDLREVDGTNVLDLDNAELDRIREVIDEREFTISSIGSPIGKIGITDDFKAHKKRFERALEIADRFDVEYIHVFSYYIPESDDPADHREEVMDRMRWKAALPKKRE